ncbi:O-antigen ligase family protein [Microlunatus flavus]|uniref:O-Antigen ligase n=1 Tax=Microlunatus flavus TaxID=1036181 RepID=A0A1H9KLI7_9ACTN|nr:O-antigen ligase family protein [Microlunatus flavus]SER00031.1 O-Antigen ligase [Microlunatus flavus]
MSERVALLEAPVPGEPERLRTQVLPKRSSAAPAPGAEPVPSSDVASDAASGAEDPAGPRLVTSVVAALLGLAAATVGLKVGAVAGVPLFAALVAAGLLVAVVPVLRRGRAGLAAFRPTAVDGVFVLYLVVRVAAELVDSGGLRGAQLGTVGDLAVSYAALWAARLAVGRPAELPRFLLVLVVTSVPVSVVAVLQIADVPRLNRLLVATTQSGGLADRLADGSDLRATSTIGHWTNLGGYLLGIITLGCLALTLGRSWRRSPGLLVVVGLAVVAQLATLTLAPVLVTVLVLVATARRLRLRAVALGAAALVVVVGALLLGGLVLNRVQDQLSRRSSSPGLTNLLPETIAYRVVIWRRETLPAIAERPWTGWGNGLYLPGSGTPRPAYLRWMSPESEWFRVAVQAGVPALLVLLALLLVVLLRLRRAARADGRWSLLVWYLSGLLVISCLHSHLSGRGTPLVLWVAVGVVLAAASAGWALPSPEPPSPAPRRALTGAAARTPFPTAAGVDRSRYVARREAAPMTDTRP